MRPIPKPIRIEPAFDDREQIRVMFERHAPYPAIAAYLPQDAWFQSTTSSGAEQSVTPLFRGNWAVGGKLLVDGAEVILHNKKFLEAAKTLFGTLLVDPSFVVVNINAPMHAGATHVDVPSFDGARREQYSLPFLKVMGSSGLFEAWRVIQAGAISWFYDGVGGSFDYWPEGLDGPMLSEQAPFGNVALISDNDRCITASAQSEIPMRNASNVGLQHRSSRMARTIGPLLRMEKSVPLTQAMRFGFPFSGRPKFGNENQGPTI